VLRAYHVAGRPNKPPALGGFNRWSDLVRGALMWLGEADPVETMHEVRAKDPKLTLHRIVAHQWWCNWLSGCAERWRGCRAM
jgi:hypothetical protein